MACTGEPGHGEAGERDGLGGGSARRAGFPDLSRDFTGEGQKPLTALAGAWHRPDEVPPSRPVPEDFDAFWAKHKEALRAAPGPQAHQR